MQEDRSRPIKLKILQVLPYFFSAWAYGGIPRVVYELSRELTRKGHDVTVDLVKYNDIEGLRDRINVVLACTPDARERSNRGREFIVNNLTWESIGNKYAALYQELANENLHC